MSIKNTKKTKKRAAYMHQILHSQPKTQTFCTVLYKYMLSIRTISSTTHPQIIGYLLTLRDIKLAPILEMLDFVTSIREYLKELL